MLYRGASTGFNRYVSGGLSPLLSASVAGPLKSTPSAGLELVDGVGSAEDAVEVPASESPADIFTSVELFLATVAGPPESTPSAVSDLVDGVGSAEDVVEVPGCESPADVPTTIELLPFKSTPQTTPCQPGQTGFPAAPAADFLHRFQRRIFGDNWQTTCLLVKDIQSMNYKQNKMNPLTSVFLYPLPDP